MSQSERRRIGRRNLRIEALESRLLLAGDALRQNIIHPEDANGDGIPTALDALIIINELNDEAPPASPAAANADVNGDGAVTPGDVLYVINSVNQRRTRSGVSRGQRIATLEKAIANDALPSGVTGEQADEILATLKHGGSPELGDRYRNGKMVNVRALSDSLPDAAGEANEPVTPPVGEPSNQPLNTKGGPAENETLQDLLGSAQQDLTDHELWQNIESTLDPVEEDALATQVRQALAENLRDAYADEAFRESVDREMYERWLTQLENGEVPPEQILFEIQAFRSTLGTVHEQIAQVFARLDLQAILENLPDLDIVVEAVTPQHVQTPNDEAVTELVTGKVFRPL